MHSCKLYKSLCLFALLIVATFASAQEFRSTLAGRVTDPQGGVIPKVKVVATEVSTNSHYSTVTGAEGLYVFPMLAPGTYELTAEVQGFKKYVQRGITIGTATRVSQDITLEIGQASEAVTVTADAPQLNTINASTAQVITTREVESLPINGRAPMDLAMLGFGVVNTGNRDQNRAFENGGFSAMSMGGAASTNNNVSLDGVPNAGTPGFGGNRAAYSPPVEAVDEVQVSAFNVDASEGGTSGGTVQITTKGGTNSLHGSATEFYQSSALNAKPHNLKKGEEKESTHQNNWSGTLGGPIYIPKIYNGKDKAFFFISYEGLKDISPNVIQSRVPTLAERSGDFSGVATIYDPLTAQLSGGKITRTAFPNNVIPKDRLNPIALNYLREFVPLPNTTELSNGINYINSTTTANKYRAFGTRLDFNLSDRNKLNMKFGTSQWTQNNGSAYSDDPNEYDPARKNTINANKVSGMRDIWNASIDDMHAFSSTFVGNFRLGFSRYRAYYENGSGGYDPTNLGFPSYIAANSGHLMIPQFTFSGNENIQPSAVAGRFVDQPYNVYQLRAGFTWSKGVHTIKFGGETQLRDFSNANWAASTGSYTFDNSWVRQDPGSSSFVGSYGSVASFLLGLPTNGATGYGLNTAQKTDSWYRALYVHDDWKVRQNLTLNIGLRWEYSTPAVEGNNRQSVGFDMTADNEITAKAKAAYTTAIPELPVGNFNPTGVVQMASDSKREAYKTYNMFAPRVGFSWSPEVLKGRTVLRGGFGIFYSIYGAINGTVYNSVPFVSTNDNGQTVFADLSKPFPQGLTPSILGSTVTFNNPDMKNQYSERWTLDIQQQLTNDLTLEVGYIGNHSVHITNTYNWNATPVGLLSHSATRDKATIDKLEKKVANPFAGLMPWSSLNGKTITVNNLVKRFPEYGNVNENNMTTGSSYYHSLAARLSKRFSKGWLMSVNYNFSKLIERNSYLNAGDTVLEKRIASDDRPHVFSVAGTYELPFGKGRKLMTSANKWVDGVLGGWAIAGTYSYHTGAPLNWGTDMIYSGGDLKWDAHNPYQVFDKTQFVTGKANQYQYHYRTFASQQSKWRVDSMSNANFTLSKMFNIKERAKVQFRAEAFNVSNRPLFGSPNTDPTSNAFGTITSEQTNTPRVFQGGLRFLF